MHALGFWHEQQRGDRDSYVQVHRENCGMSDGEWRANMDKIPWLDTGHEYDFNSIMQYDGFACSNNTLPTITLLSNNQVRGNFNYPTFYFVSTSILQNQPHIQAFAQQQQL